MHSMSSMPRHSSQEDASFQFLTPLRFLMKAGRRVRSVRPGRASFLEAGINHQKNVSEAATIAVPPRLRKGGLAGAEAAHSLPDVEEQRIERIRSEWLGQNG